MDPFGIGTWIAGRILSWASARARLSLAIRTDEAGGLFFAAVSMDGDVHYAGTPSRRDVIVRVVNVGPKPVAVERVAIELETGELIDLEGGERLPRILNPPEHLERDDDREGLKLKVGTRRVRRIVAITNDGARHHRDVDGAWHRTDTWPT